MIVRMNVFIFINKCFLYLCLIFILIIFRIWDFCVAFWLVDSNWVRRDEFCHLDRMWRAVTVRWGLLRAYIYIYISIFCLGSGCLNLWFSKYKHWCILLSNPKHNIIILFMFTLQPFLDNLSVYLKKVANL